MASTAKIGLRHRKQDIVDILSWDLDFIFNKVHEKGILTDREYHNLKYPTGLAPGDVTRLVDKVVGKGESTCKVFVNLLKEDLVTDNYPMLKDIFFTTSGPTSSPSHNGSILALPTMCTDVPTQESGDSKEEGLMYEMKNNPRGLCLIINNEHFANNKDRQGTQADVDALVKVFSSLKFKVALCYDQTKKQIADVLPLFASLNLPELQKRQVQEWSGSQFTDLKELPPHSDAFVCCILSHGDKGGIFGTDDEFLPTSDITSTFTGRKCPALVNKPKVFIIQACQGSQIQGGVQVDSAGDQEEMETDDPDPNTTTYYIPEESDFLLALSTVEKYKSFRHTESGSWFIQSLCKRLDEGSNRGDDVLSIFTQVNNDVSLKEEKLNRPGKGKQMPEQRTSLRKKLVFRK